MFGVLVSDISRCPDYFSYIIVYILYCNNITFVESVFSIVYSHYPDIAVKIICPTVKDVLIKMNTVGTFLWIYSLRHKFMHSSCFDEFVMGENIYIIRC